MKTTTIPTDLLLDVLDEAEQHAAARPPSPLLGPYRATAAEALRAFLTGRIDALLVIETARAR